MHNKLKLRDTENWYMQEALERVGEVKKGEFPLENLEFFVSGLIKELKSRTSANLTYSPSEEGGIVEPEESDNKLSTITAYQIFADGKPLGKLGVRTALFSNDPELEKVYGNLSFLTTYDSIVYEGEIPGYTPDNEKTVLVANAFNCLPQLFKDPLFRICFMGTRFEKARETGVYDKLGFLENNCSERPMKRHDNHPIALASYESDGLERKV